MQSAPSCPCCRSPKVVQRVASIVERGPANVRIVTDDLEKADVESRTNLKQLLAPPQQPGGGWVVFAALVGLLVMSVPFSCVASMVIDELLWGAMANHSFPSAELQRLFLVVFGLAVLASIGLAVLLSVGRERRQRPVREAWGQQMSRWQQSWYCYRCHRTFVAGSSQAVVPEQFAQLLGGQSGLPR